MAYGIQTPSLMALSQPYYDRINDVIDGAYGFKAMVRDDYLRDRAVPARATAADLQYANNMYGIADRWNTFEDDLATSSLGSQLARMGREADVNIFPELRGLQDQAAIYGATNQVAGYEDALAKRENSILEGQADSQYQGMIAGAIGDTLLDKTLEVYNAAIEQNADPRIRNRAQQGVIDAARRAASMMPPGSPEYEKAIETLRRFGQYGTAPAQRGILPRFMNFFKG